MTPAQATDMVVVSGFPDDDVTIPITNVGSLRVGDLQRNMAIYGSDGVYTIDGEVFEFTGSRIFAPIVSVRNGTDVWICNFDPSKTEDTTGDQPPESFDGYIPVLEYYGPYPGSDYSSEFVKIYMSNKSITTVPNVGLSVGLFDGYKSIFENVDSASLKLNFYRITPSDTEISNTLANSKYSEVSALLDELEPVETYDFTDLIRNGVNSTPDGAYDTAGDEYAAGSA